MSFNTISVNTNPPKEGIQVLFSEKERRERPYDSLNIFKKSNIERFLERPRSTFCNGKYSSILHDFLYADFLAYYTRKNDSSKTYKYQPEELDDNFIEKNHEKCSYSPKIELMISRETMRCQNARGILDIICQLNFYLQKNMLII